MNPDCDICQFLQQPLKNQVITTEHWTAGIISDQPYLGRCLVTLLNHKGSLSELSDEEWRDFQSIVRKLEPAYKKAFGANPLNIGCFMNHGYKDDTPHPHVHWQIFPRYKQPVEFDGMTWEDERYGEFYDNDAERLVSDEVVARIVQKLNEAMQ